MVDSMGNRRTAGHLAALFTIIIWGTTFISTKVLLTDPVTPVPEIRREAAGKFFYRLCGGNGGCPADQL